MLCLVGGIDEFNGAWRARTGIRPERLDLIERVAFIESVASAVRMAGGGLSNQVVERLTMGLEFRSLEPPDEQQAVGYAEALKLAHTSWRAMNLNTNHIRQLHGIMLKYSVRDRDHKGEFRRSQDQVEELVAATRRSLREDEFHPLLVVAAFEADFLAVSPFQDGNRRISHILIDLLLLRSGYSFVPYISRERTIEEIRDAYSPDDWPTLFLKVIKMQTDRLEAKLGQERTLISLPELSERLLGIVQDHGRITMGEAIRITGRSRDTLKPHLRRLVGKGWLKKHGKGKGTVYSTS